MMRIVLGVIVGFIAWMMMWVGSEWIISELWPTGFGVHQRAFQEAIEKGGPFSADRTMLLVHLVLGAMVSTAAGFLAATISGENKRAPLGLGVLLLAMGIAKMALSWPYVPLWYHVIFTGLLMPLAILGGKLRGGTPSNAVSSKVHERDKP